MIERREASERPKQIVLQKHRKMSSRPSSAKFKDYSYKNIHSESPENEQFSLSPDKLRAPVLSGANNLFNLKIFKMAIDSGNSPSSSFAKSMKQKQNKSFSRTSQFEPVSKKLPAQLNPSAPVSRVISSMSTPADQSMNVSR